MARVQAGGSAAPAYGATRPFAGISLLVLSAWALSTLDASGKWAMGAGASLVLLCWVRYVVHFVLVFSLVFPKHRFKVFRPVRPKAQLIRGFTMLLATMSFFTTLHYLPQAEATAIGFLAPLIMLAVAPWLLNEPPRLSRWVAAAVGFLGVLVIIRPGGGLPPVGVVFGLITACLFAAQFILTRRVAVDDPFTTLVWSGGVGSVLLTGMLPFMWSDILYLIQTLDAFTWLVMAGTGFWGALGHLLQIQAYRCAPASMLAPFLYLQIVAASTIGWLIWGHFPDAVTWVGIGIICASGISVGYLEWRGRKHQAA